MDVWIFGRIMSIFQLFQNVLKLKKIIKKSYLFQESENQAFINGCILNYNLMMQLLCDQMKKWQYLIL